MRLLALGSQSALTYATLCENIKEFKCGATGTGVPRVKMTVELRLYESTGSKVSDETGRFVTLGSYEYVFEK